MTPGPFDGLGVLFLYTEGMSENPRIGELRRRVERDPTSIAFAQLAEEYRRIGAYDEAIKVCREGLTRHPGYLSAQVTLGRALMELQQFDEACTELESVLRAAPDNLAAIRALADIHQRRGDVPETMDLHMAPLDEALPLDVSLDATMPSFDQMTDSGGEASSNAGNPPAAFDALAAVSFEELPSLEALDALSLDLPPLPDLADWTLDANVALDLPTPTFAEVSLDQLEVNARIITPEHPAPAVQTSRPPMRSGPMPEDPILEELEEWLVAIVADRSQSL
jgi:tetratricopeptide (TPR) repeat protein